MKKQVSIFLQFSSHVVLLTWSAVSYNPSEIFCAVFQYFRTISFQFDLAQITNKFKRFSG